MLSCPHSFTGSFAEICGGCQLPLVKVKIHQRGGAVETGCSGLHSIIGCFII